MATSTVFGMKSGTIIEVSSIGEEIASEAQKKYYAGLNELNGMFKQHVMGYTSMGEPTLINIDEVEFVCIRVD
jgi:hypothetical protein